MTDISSRFFRVMVLHGITECKGDVHIWFAQLVGKFLIYHGFYVHSSQKYAYHPALLQDPEKELQDSQ